MAKKKKTKQVKEEYTSEEQQQIRDLASNISRLLDNHRMDMVAEALSVVLGFCVAHADLTPEGSIQFLLNLNKTVLQHAIAANIMIEKEEGSVH